MIATKTMMELLQLGYSLKVERFFNQVSITVAREEVQQTQVLPLDDHIERRLDDIVNYCMNELTKKL